MKKSVLAAIALSLLCTYSSFAQGITIFWDENYAGQSFVINGDWDASSDMRWNDQISSIRIPAGYKIQVFEHTNFGGVSKTLSGDWTVGGPNFNDFISSIKILEYPSQAITVYRDANYQGSSLQISSDWDATSNMNWNDQISSIRIPAGIRIQVFEHTQFGGASKILSGDWTVTNSDFNDFISSIKFLEKGTTAGTDRLCCGQSLNVGGVVESLNHRFFLVFQDDRNLVLYKKTTGGNIPMWATASNNNADKMVMQGDGNFVVYNGTRPVWASNTNGKVNAFLVVQDDGNLVIYATDGRAIWASNTAQPAETVEVAPVVTAPATVASSAPCSMQEQQFNAAVHAVEAQSFRDGKIKMAKQAIKNKCLSLDQVRTMAKLFSFEDQTLDFLKYAYDFTNSKDDYYTLADIFSFKTNSDDFMAFLEGK